jgi:hypothetical protein
MKLKDASNLTRLGVLTYIGGWSGGYWEIDGQRLKRKELPSKVVVGYKDNLFEVEVGECSGWDEDHGHSQEWTCLDFIFKRETIVGVSEISFHKNWEDISVSEVTLYMEH